MRKLDEKINEILNDICEYNTKVPQEQKISTTICNDILSTIKEHNIEWTKIPFFALVSSISKSIPQNPDNVAAKEFYEYTTDAFRKFYYNLSTMILSCNNSNSVFLVNKDKVDLKQLLQLYTEYANGISNIVVSNMGTLNDKKHRDFFFAVIDFKNDIHVEHITNFRDQNGDDNLSVIHIPPEEIYNCPEVLRTITHEVAHHVGQTAVLRGLRAELYAKCLFYYILYHHATNKNNVSGDFSKSLERVTDRLQRILTEYLQEIKYKFRASESDCIANDGSKILYGNVEYTYYTSTTFSAIAKFFDGLSMDDSLKILLEVGLGYHLSQEDIEVLLNVLVSCFEFSSVSDKNSNYLAVFSEMKQSLVLNKEQYIKQFSLNCILSTIYDALLYYGHETSINNDANIDTIKIQHDIFQLFRECYADLFMLVLTSHCENDNNIGQCLADLYFDKMISSGNSIKSFNCDDGLRFYVIYKFLSEVYNDGKSLNLHDEIGDIELFESKLNHFEKFHVECVITYLKECEKQIRECLEEKKYFIELEAFFRKIDSLDNVHELLQQLEQFNEKYKLSRIIQLQI